jgi:hypothetical protein
VGYHGACAMFGVEIVGCIESICYDAEWRENVRHGSSFIRIISSELHTAGLREDNARIQTSIPMCTVKVVAPASFSAQIPPFLGEMQERNTCYRNLPTRRRPSLPLSTHVNAFEHTL